MNIEPTRSKTRWVINVVDDNEYEIHWYETDDEGITSCDIELLTSNYECPAGSSLDWALSHGGIQCDDVASLSNPDGVIHLDKVFLECINNWRNNLDKELSEFYRLTTR